eukprot:1274889-Prymnesium_polylepis.1
MLLARRRRAREGHIANVQRSANGGLVEVRCIVAEGRGGVRVHEVVIVVEPRDVMEVVAVRPDIAVQELVPNAERLQHLALLDERDGPVAVALDHRLLVLIAQPKVVDHVGLPRRKSMESVTARAVHDHAEPSTRAVHDHARAFDRSWSI